MGLSFPDSSGRVQNIRPINYLGNKMMLDDLKSMDYHSMKIRRGNGRRGGPMRIL